MDIWWWPTFHLTIILLFIYYFVSCSIFHFPSDSFTCNSCRGDMTLNKCEWCSDRKVTMVLKPDPLQGNNNPSNSPHSSKAERRQLTKLPCHRC
jgi:hypothetical protein